MKVGYLLYLWGEKFKCWFWFNNLRKIDFWWDSKLFNGNDSEFIPVEEETKDLISIGNENDKMMKIQLTTKELR